MFQCQKTCWRHQSGMPKPIRDIHRSSHFFECIVMRVRINANNDLIPVGVGLVYQPADSRRGIAGLNTNRQPGGSGRGREEGEVQGSADGAIIQIQSSCSFTRYVRRVRLGHSDAPDSNENPRACAGQ